MLGIRWRRLVFVAPIAAAVLAGCVPPAPQAPVSQASPIPADVPQLVTVVTDDWGAVVGALHAYDRRPDGSWAAAGIDTQIDVGRSGMGWGAGLHHGGVGPQKSEGDGRAPAGAFTFGTAFGYDPQSFAIPYLQVGPQHRCVDDPHSAHYNQIVDSNAVPVDWRSSEPMRRDDGQYQLGLVVQDNPADVPGAGSCIFLHVWRGLGSGTAGCTAMPIAAMDALLGWMRRAVLVQLPLAVYRQVQAGWGLPPD
jgi:L,D-peptidoglycan transpeptidase YkuD (ErfK/YbiS/YcfS/YnhG family)